MRRRSAFVALVAALAAAGCPPPPDLHPSPASAPAGETSRSAAPPATPTSPVPAPQPDAPQAPASSEPVAPAVSTTPKPTTYEHLSGGTFVARCTACGAVQPPSSTQCPSCGQVLRPWRQEQLCTVCTGSGQCDRCGDDRVCLDCDGLGVCPYCSGSGKLGAQVCFECNGNGRCAACQGDGRRESANHDFGPYETKLPGICPTCIGGSGLCPDCGTLTKDGKGGECVTCGGSGICFDCGGSGLCPHDAGDGLCLVCGGGGREVFDGDPPKLSDRVWLLRLVSGTPFTGRVFARADPNVHVQATQGGSVTRSAYTRAMLSPLTYYLAVRDWTPQTDAKGLLDLGTVAFSSGFWPVAQQDFRRAMAADTSLGPEAAAQLREIGDRQTLEWLDSAEKAKKQGNRDGATLYLNMVRFKARGTPQATRADVIQLQIQRDADDEAKNLDDAARAKAADESKARAERAAAGARLRLDRARKLLREAQQRPAGDPGVDRLLARADQSAYAAQRLVQREAYRDPASATPWTVKPEVLVREGRLVRAEVAVFHAGREIAAGRFDFGARLGRRAGALDPTSSKASQLVAEAELGLARRGVLRGSPAPKNK